VNGTVLDESVGDGALACCDPAGESNQIHACNASSQPCAVGTAIQVSVR
jgi:hypothetical protein